MPDFMSDMLCVSKYEIPALLSKIEAELYKELETNLFPYNENANDKIPTTRISGPSIGIWRNAKVVRIPPSSI